MGPSNLDRAVPTPSPLHQSPNVKMGPSDLITTLGNPARSLVTTLRYHDDAQSLFVG
jgi:hypothetical protein